MTWFVVGAAFGFGGLALAFASLGAILLLPAVAIGAMMMIFRIRPAAMLLVGAGIGIAVPWTLHITSGDTPDRQLWPVLVGGVLIGTGLLIFFRQNREQEPRLTPRARSV